MSELDKRIEEALSAEDRALLEQFGEQGIFDQLGGLFSGKMAWLSVVTFVFGLGMFVLAIYSVFYFVRADNMHDMLRWSGQAWFGFMGLFMIKIWSWMRMESNRVIREVKRLELQIAHLSLHGE